LTRQDQTNERQSRINAFKENNSLNGELPFKKKDNPVPIIYLVSPALFQISYERSISNRGICTVWYLNVTDICLQTQNKHLVFEIVTNIYTLQK
jgi:hypothetical protein